MRLPILAIAIGVAVSPALAQSSLDIDRWAADKHVYVTKQARNEALQAAAKAAEAARIAAKPSQMATIVRESQPPIPRSRAEAETREPAVGWLEKFPTIRLIVQPAPPRDYSVAINGEECPATERSLYKVPYGAVEVRVVRSGKPPCVWTGRLMDGRTQEVPCNF